jgi:hypothetical protein
VIAIAKIKKEQTVLKQVQQLINKECANYFYKCDEVTSYCCREWTKDLSCIYFQPEPEFDRCKYFEETCLPLSEEIKIIYNLKYIDKVDLTSKQQREIKQEIDWVNRPRRKCENPECGEIFPAKSNRQKLCDSCGILKRKEKEKMRQAGIRKNKHDLI